MKKILLVVEESSCSRENSFIPDEIPVQLDLVPTDKIRNYSKVPDIVIFPLMDYSPPRMKDLFLCRELFPFAFLWAGVTIFQIEEIIPLVKAGIDDFLSYPYKKNEIIRRIKMIYLNRSINVNGREFLVGESPIMAELKKKALYFAQTDYPVLLYGETGTGKECMARFIHHHSACSGGPFIAVNLAAIPETLLSSELFGTEKGAFTDCRKTRKGMIEQADQGTLFLDELEDLPLSAQTCLLRFIESNEIRRIGGEGVIHVKPRLVCSTNQPLKQLVLEGKFRNDLYYRLNILPLLLSPLKERQEDIPLLCSHFLKGRTISREALERLFSYDWPGNVRELHTILERAMAISRGTCIHSGDILFD